MYFTAPKIKFAKIAAREVFKRNPLRFSMILVFGFLSGILGGVGIGALIPLFSLVSGRTSEQVGSITKVIENFFGFLHLPLTIPWLVVLIAVLFVTKALVHFIAKYLNIKTAAEYEERIRRDVFSKTLNATWPFLLKQKSGYLERIMVNDVAIGASIILRVTNLVLLVTSLLMYLAVALTISSFITSVTLVIGAVLFFAFHPFLERIRQIAKIMAKAEKNTAHHINEALGGAKIVKSFGVEPNIIQKSRKYFQLLKEVRVKTDFFRYILGQAFEPVGIVFIVLLFVFYQRFPGFNIVSFAAIVYLIEKMFVYLQAAQGELYTINQAAPYLKAFADFRTSAEENKEINDGRNPFIFKEDLRFNDVEFSYMEDRKILSGINFSVNKGEMVGLVGPSGAGKTTIVDLLLRLFNPSSGDILVDGKKIKEIDLVDWRGNIRYVSQDVFLLNDTIDNNIRFFDESISHKDIIEASKMANVYDFINSLSQGFNTVIGERGVMLSGGERQRIALSRALVKIPSLLILDEATSSLDSESELLIQQAIENLRGKTTVIIIAHRLSTVTNCDKLVVLDEGKIVEQGSPKELLNNTSSSFYKMYDMQNKPNSKPDYVSGGNQND